MPRRTASHTAEPRRRRRPDPFAQSRPGRDGAARPCDRAGCAEAGDYRAPMAPDRLGEHYWFCLDHVRAYNRAWNFCAGRDEREIEALIREDVVGWRPTWPLGRLGGAFARDRFDRMRDDFGLFGDRGDGPGANGRAGSERRRDKNVSGTRLREQEALDLMELVPPLTLTALRARYKELVKRHHPDANGGDKGAEERLKLINQAYATLKQSLGARP